MPTGYTADVRSGKVTDFPTFAMQCARAFGALITMRDDPAGAPIPEKFEPDDYYAKALETARARVAELHAMTTDQRQVAADAANVAAIASWERYEQQKRDTRARYEAMRKLVSAWTPPTPDHDELKSFMIDQLDESTRFDCGPSFSSKPIPKKRDEWFNHEMAEAQGRVARYAEEYAKEVDRAARRTEWVAALRTSLK